MMKKSYAVHIALSWSLLLFTLQLPEVNQGTDYFFLIVTLATCCLSYCLLYAFSDIRDLIFKKKKRKTIWWDLLDTLDGMMSAAIFLCLVALVLMRTEYPVGFGLIWLALPALTLFLTVSFIQKKIQSLYHRSLCAELENVCKDFSSTSNNIKMVTEIYEELNFKSSSIENYINQGNEDSELPNAHKVPTEADSYR
ncbi:hypothetical protein L2755_12055 [Shewanella abyssi]|uniref:hypothetical protein n=1 Tax=Shewanella abyssi TaxID=311789 RepID=UPI00200DD354|nr:hypothetical protein [Shewanella abyssi]MCL1050356.1 hypothetical protein [Shewanella abyssi]